MNSVEAPKLTNLLQRPPETIEKLSAIPKNHQIYIMRNVKRNTTIELAAIKNQIQNISSLNSPKLAKSLFSPKDNSWNLEEDSISQKNRVLKEKEDYTFVNLQDSISRDFKENADSFQRDRSYSNLEEECVLLRRLLKLKQKEIEFLFEKTSCLEKEIDKIRLENMRLSEENKMIDKKKIKNIKNLQIKHNESYFKEKEQYEPATLPNSSLMILQSEKSLKKYAIHVSYEDLLREKPIPISLEQIKFNLLFDNERRKEKYAKFGMISSVNIQILEYFAKNIESIEMLIRPSEGFLSFYFISMNFYLFFMNFS